MNRISFVVGQTYVGWGLCEADRPLMTVDGRGPDWLIDTDGRSHKIVIGEGPSGEDCETVRIDERGPVAHGGVFRACARVGGAP